MRTNSWLPVSALVLFAAVGCGDDNDKSSGPPSNKQVADLSTAEARSLCVSLQRRFDSFTDAALKLTCTALGMTFGEASGGSCSQLVSMCLDQAGMEESGGLECDADTGGDSTDIQSSCPEVTVGELNGCVDALAAAYQSAAKAASCSSTAEAAYPATPSACTALRTTCPMLATLSEDFMDEVGSGLDGDAFGDDSLSD